MSYYLFNHLKTPRDVSTYNLFRGTTDWTQLQQFDLFKSGFPYLVHVTSPKFLEAMADTDDQVKALLNNYVHVVECEFLGFDSGLQNMDAETDSISNGQESVNVILKTNGTQAQNFSMSYREKAGGTITKTHELFLRCVSDPATTFKTYNGYIGFGQDQVHPDEIGFDWECFSWLYMHTDQTGLLLERSAYITCCQPTTGQIDIYNGKKGEVRFADISVEYTGFPIQGERINQRAKAILDWMNDEANAAHVVRNSWNYNYDGIEDAAYGLGKSSLAPTATT